MLETSHPPHLLFAAKKMFEMQCLNQNITLGQFVSFKGRAHVLGRCKLVISKPLILHGAIPKPTKAFLPIKDYLAFYASKMDACYVGNETGTKHKKVIFYGGWITSEIVGTIQRWGGGTWGVVKLGRFRVFSCTLTSSISIGAHKARLGWREVFLSL